jgi:hypothetical protein
MNKPLTMKTSAISLPRRYYRRNKEDRATAESHAAFDTWWQHFGGERHVYTTQGNIDNALLDLPRLNQTELLPAQRIATAKAQTGSGGAEPA